MGYMSNLNAKLTQDRIQEVYHVSVPEKGREKAVSVNEQETLRSSKVTWTK